MEEKFEIELKQTVQFDSMFDAIEEFCSHLICDSQFVLSGRLTKENINDLFSSFINEIVYWRPYDGIKFTNYQAEVASVPDFLNQCVISFDLRKKEEIRAQKETVERLKKQLENAQNKLKALE